MRETFVPHNFIITIQSALRKGLRQWFAEIFFAALTACGTVSEWIRNSNNEKRYRKFYRYAQRLGRFDEKIQNVYGAWLVGVLKDVLQTEPVVRLALDDSPIKRYGPKVEGAGVIHDPTNVTDKKAKCYGHSWVALSLIVDHPKWGTVSLPLRWKFYVRKKDLAKIDESVRPEFRTKLQIGAELVKQAVATIRKSTDKPVQLAFDSGYVSDKLFEEMKKLDVEIVTRFKKNSVFYKLPERPKTPKRGRPRKYGDSFKLNDLLEDDTAEMFSDDITLYGGVKRVEFKTAIATTQIADGRPVRLIASRFVKGDETGVWVVFVSTNLTATPQTILREYSRRFSIEEMFKDLKEVCGLGGQEVRKWESCKACATIAALGFAAIEIWAWERDGSELTATRSPWDARERRPSHKNKRDLAARIIGFENFSRNIARSEPGEIQEKILRLARLLGLAV